MKKALNSEKELLAALVAPYSEETTLMEDLELIQRGTDVDDGPYISEEVQDNLPGEDYASRESIIDLTYNPETGVWE